MATISSHIKFYISLVFGIACLAHSSRGLQFYEEESNLREYLFGTNATSSIGYNKRVRPQNSTIAHMNLILLSLIDLDIERQEMSVTVLAYTEWMDERLMWDKNDYGGIDSLSIDVTDTWYPPILFRNAVDDLNFAGKNSIPFRVTSDGRVFFAPPINLRTSCDMSVVYFPFDTQSCTIEVYPFSYTKEEVQVIAYPDTKVSLSYYTPNAAWEYVTSSTSTTGFVEANNQTFSGLVFTLEFKRLWLYTLFSIILPTLFNLSLMLGVFMLHVESGEKMGYSLTVLLSYVVLLTMVSDQLPSVSTQVCLLQVYLALVLFVGTLSTLLTIWVINVYNRDEERHPITPKTRRIIKWVVLPFTSFALWRNILCRCTETKKQNKKQRKEAFEFETLRESPYLNDRKKTFPTTSAPSSSPTPPPTLPPPSSTSLYPTTSKRPTRNRSSVSPINGIDNECKTNSTQPQTPAQTQDNNVTNTRNSHSDFDRTGTNFTKTPTYVINDSTKVSTHESSKQDDHQSLFRQQDTPTTSYYSKPEHDLPLSLESLLEQLTWKDIAIMIDAFLLRVLGGILLILAVLLIVVFNVQYDS